MTIAPSRPPRTDVLHWVVFPTISVQWLCNEPMKHTIEAMQTGATFAENDMTIAWVVGFGSMSFLAETTPLVQAAIGSHVDYWTRTKGALIHRSKGASRKRLRRPESHAGLRKLEIPPSHVNKRIAQHKGREFVHSSTDDNAYTHRSPAAIGFHRSPPLPAIRQAALLHDNP